MRRLVLLLALLCAALVSAQTQPAKLRRGDEIMVSVVGYDKYSGDYTVLDDGSVVGIGFGRVQAQGKTIDELTSDIVAQLKKRFKDPTVEIVLKKQAPRFIYIVGGAHQEPITYLDTLDLRQIVGMAGLPDTPEMTECRISRAGEPVRLVSLPKLLQGEPSEWNGPLQPDDVVTFLTRIFRVTVSGEVNTPGEVTVRNDSQLVAAIAEAKGITKEGTLKNVLVFRGPDVFQVDVSAAEKGQPVNFLLQPGDSVVVRKSETAVYVLGEVRMPGRYVIPDNKSYTAADLLASAEGLTSNGSLRRVTLVRANDTGKFVASSFNLDEFLKNGKIESNPKLLPGDVVLFSQPKAVQILSLNQIASTAFLLSGIIKR
ncbi:MAG: polysaccharide biosynthesis/export protein [Fimbriimonadaceae bacterium]|jgi:protein involved in polysaccharide export with SLBB domain|nr:polysaccharide biosynthesis/export protein [Fimbriimonadaceae bacterium]